MPNDFNEEHYLRYHMNHALTTPEGKEVVASLKESIPDLFRYITGVIDTHEEILKKHFSDKPDDKSNGVQIVGPVV